MSSLAIKLISREDAIACGLNVYFTGKPCKYGHLTVRWIKSRSCTECVKLNALRYQAARPKQHNEKSKKWRLANPEKWKAIKRSWRQRNPEKIVEEQQAKRARKLKAMPRWVGRGELRSIYKDCRRITKETGIQHHVDHIVPLVNDTVCGLHVPWNLRIISAQENLAKNNIHVLTSGRASLRVFSAQEVETDFHQIEVAATDLV